MKKLPAGVSDFNKLVTNNYYYVDKTKFIKSVINEGGDVTLYTRPRRFGKSLKNRWFRIWNLKKNYLYNF